MAVNLTNRIKAMTGLGYPPFPLLIRHEEGLNPA